MAGSKFLDYLCISLYWRIKKEKKRKKREERDQKSEGKDSIECAVVSLGVGVACLLVQFERKLCLRRRVIETFKRQFPSLSTDTLNGRQRHGEETKTGTGTGKRRRKKLRSEMRKRNGKLNGARGGGTTHTHTAAAIKRDRGSNGLAGSDLCIYIDMAR